MESRFAWLDSTERERRKVLEVVDLFREDDTRDELGLGTIRDAFSDKLFPGTSTIQTRARYFLLVPWLMLELEKRRTPSADAGRTSRSLQGRLRNGLIKGGEKTGVIGYRAGLDVQRLPSNVYWQGLRRWGILRYHGSEDGCRRSLDGHYRRLGRKLHADDGEPTDDVEAMNWDPRLPPAPEGLLKEVTFRLHPDEADYLIHRIAVSAPDSLLIHLLELGKPIPESAQFVWEHVAGDSLPASLAREVHHARCFSECMHGAAVLYNLLLAEEAERDDLVGEYRRSMGGWWDLLRQRSDVLDAWDEADFWLLLREAAARVTPPTHDFVDQWLLLVRQARRLSTIMSGRSTRRLIIDRERQLKKARARMGNPRALELWNGAAGTAQLDYRWNRPVRVLVGDILDADRSGA